MSPRIGCILHTYFEGRLTVGSEPLGAIAGLTSRPELWVHCMAIARTVGTSENPQTSP
ncbi:hypothetical protein [Lyngbya sp. CCY1209]|uniref:hypothetical protein n=1 Tax=Lyngbya sp. CCY1209 TaxID=2886103 RepID=UPI002D213635|nr:hypothetical protein [Lyngbya sp. CCY1209]MEB3887459.1 hypothetical protein [Lyngbya sp. CCY1209]